MPVTGACMQVHSLQGHKCVGRAHTDQAAHSTASMSQMGLPKRLTLGAASSEAGIPSKWTPTEQLDAAGHVPPKAQPRALPPASPQHLLPQRKPVA